MPSEIQHNYRFDAAGKLDADDWLELARAELKPGFVLDRAFADAMVRCYFNTVSRYSLLPAQVIQEGQTARVCAPLGKTVVVLAAPERIVDERRAETSWQIAGGFLLAHRVTYGGRFYLGAEWQPDGALKLYSTIRRFPPRLVSALGVARGVPVYFQTQGRVQRRVQENFLGALAAQLAQGQP